MATKHPLNKQSLTQIARKLATLEKNDVRNAIVKGGLLEEAREQCSDDGTYMTWLESINWSYRSAKRYRNAFVLFQTNRQIADLFISVSALHLLADPRTSEKARRAIIKAAALKRVGYSDALAIMVKIEEETRPVDEHDDDDDDEEHGDEEHDDDDETPTPDPDDAPPSELITAVNNVMLPYWLRSDAWPKVIKTIGPVKFREFIAALQAVYNKHCETSAVKSAADRAEAKAAMTAKEREKEPSDG